MTLVAVPLRSAAMVQSALAAGATLVAVAFAMSTFDRWLARRRRHELAWAVALVLFAAGALFFLLAPPPPPRAGVGGRPRPLRGGRLLVEARRQLRLDLAHLPRLLPVRRCRQR